MTTESPAAQDAVVAGAFTKALASDITPQLADDQVIGGLIVVEHDGCAWWITVKPDRVAYVRNANGHCGRFRHAAATPEQDRRLRLRMLLEFGGQW